MTASPTPPSSDSEPLLPVEIEFYIEADGTVVFADLAADIIPIAQELNPDQPLLCDLPDAAELDAGADQ
jgi:hypothetical protein